MRFARKQATIDPLHRDISPRLAKFRYLWFLTIVFVMTLVLFNLATLRFVVDGDSMQAHFQNGQFLIVNRVAYNFTEPQRGDIIVFHMPLNAEQDLLKRIIALPGEAIELRDTEIYINGHQLSEPYLNESCLPIHCADGFWQLGLNEYFVMGDNRNHSRDSRTFGIITHDLIIGEAVLRYWPLSDLAWIHRIGYIDDE